jgi:hypothetical protein
MRPGSKPSSFKISSIVTPPSSDGVEIGTELDPEENDVEGIGAGIEIGIEIGVEIGWAVFDADRKGRLADGKSSVPAGLSFRGGSDVKAG